MKSSEGIRNGNSRRMPRINGHDILGNGYRGGLNKSNSRSHIFFSDLLNPLKYLKQRAALLLA